MTTSWIFPTPIGTARPPEDLAETLSEYLRHLTLTLMEQHPEGWGHDWAEGCGIWNSHCVRESILDSGAPLMGILRGWIRDRVADFAKSIGVAEGYEVVIDDSWLNIVKPGQFQEYHIHGNCHFSGCFYIDIPKDSGDFVVRNPTRVVYFPDLDDDAGLAEEEATTPKAGDLVLFPSWLDHRVAQNLSEKWRFSLAFNARMELTE